MSDMKVQVLVGYDGKAVAAGAQANAADLKAIGDAAGASAAKASAALQGVAISAKQTAAAMRNVPAQMTDIFVGLASGQSPLMVLLQQGGQLKDMFGGIGPAIGAVATFIRSLINPFTIVAAVAAAASYAMYRAFKSNEEPAKALGDAVTDLAAAVGGVGKVAREISMDSLYKEFNKASAGARASIIDIIKFQQTLIETQSLLARKSLSKSLEGLGEYGFGDKIQGAFAKSASEKLSKELGVSAAAAKDMLPAIKYLRDGSEDAGNFMARFGGELAKSSKGSTQQLIKDIKSVADGSRDAAAAQSRLSEALQKMGQAGEKGQILIPGKTGKGAKAVRAFDPEGDLAYILEEAQRKRVRAALIAADEEADALEAKAAAMDAAHMKRMEMYRIETEGEEAVREHLEKTTAAIDEMSQFTIEAARNMQDAMADGFFDIMQGKFDKLGSSFKATLDRMVANAIAANLSEAMFGNFGKTGKVGGWAEKLLNMLPGGGGGDSGALDFAGEAAAFIDPFAAGGVLRSAGLHPYANTIVSSPTLFKFAQGGAFSRGLMGESGPEAIMPLTRGPDGRLGVQASGGANITVIVQGATNAPDVRRAAGQGAREALTAFSGAQRYG